MPELRVIKKYPNRRLYDTAVSKYITLEDIRLLVLNQTVFCVRDTKTKEDITRSILLQVILEQEDNGEPILTEQLLTQIIRFYGDSLQGMMTNYLEDSMRMFVEQQSRLKEQFEGMMTGNPMSIMNDLAQRNVKLWQEMQRGFLDNARTGPAARGDSTATAKSEPADTDAD